MSKKTFIEAVKLAGGYKTTVEAEKAVAAFTKAVTTTVTANQSVSIVGFGSFKPTLQKGKSGLIPGTTKTYTSQEKLVCKFKAGKALADSVAGK